MFVKKIPNGFYRKLSGKLAKLQRELTRKIFREFVLVQLSKNNPPVTYDL